MRFRSLVAGLFIISVPFMSGCTPEKAEALLTAIKAFEFQSAQALAAYEELFKDYRAVKRESQDELFAQAYDAVVKSGVTNESFEVAISNVGQLQNDRANTKIENEFQQLKSAYSMLSSAYESLPQGSLIGAKYVSCGRMAVAKLTKQLLNFSSDIDVNPLYPALLRQDFADFKALAVQTNSPKDKARQKFDAFYSGVAGYEKKHREAIAKTLAAAEQGKKLDQLLARYDAATISNILGVIQYGLSFAGTLNGVDVSKSSARLKAVKDDMEKDGYWKQVESMPLTSVTECKIQTGN
ncbi:MAG: hypothetical protein ACK5RJ_14215 [Burkholderiales bacterium]|jgi:hypothetical protein|nr:hypothetical protein [Rhodocyclaceae bacterium]MCA3051807.1 hypothetical protein [Rhodocyclaceae bacterium]MCA3056387.1 hypothetical protein [Rhodocyclaceae bacterium]